MREQTQKEQDALEQIGDRLADLARDIGTVKSVADRRFDPDADHRAMLKRLDDWSASVWKIRDDLSTLRAEQTRLREALQELLDAGDFAVTSADDIRIMLRLGKATDQARAALSSTPTPETTP